MEVNEPNNDEFDEIQKNEIEVLKSIFGESFELMGEKRKKKSSRPCFKITLVPYFDNALENHCSVALQIRYTKTYPNELPTIWIKKIKGLSEAEIEDLTKLVTAKGQEHLGTEMVYDLTQTIEAYLIQHNKKPKSFYDQMLDRQREQEIAEMAREQEQLEKKHKEQVELESKIQSEMKKKEEVLRRLGRDDSSDDLHQIKSMKDSWGLSSDDDRGTGTSGTSEDLGSSAENRIQNNTNVKTKSSPLAVPRTIHNTNANKFDDFYSTQGPMLDRTKDHDTNTSPSHNVVTKKPEKIQWTKTKDLGEGAFGKVYKGINRSNGQIIVIKEITVMNSSMDPASEHNQLELVESIKKDVELARTRLPHPNLVKYLGTEFVDNVLYIFTEYVPGSVQNVFNQAKKFEEPVFKKYAKQILMALNHLHGTGFTCNNLKLSNLLLDNFGNIKISDYIAIRKISDLKNGASAKNANYWSPDVRKRQARERKEDIYQLGMILVEMASGTQYAENIPKHISKEAKDFIDLCLKTDEKDRPEAVKLLAHKFVQSEPSFSENSTMNDITYPPHHPLAISDMSISSNLIVSQDSSVASRNSLSRYRQDFDELEVLGRGGFGQVVKARNKLDGRVYAIKKIRFGRTDSRFMQKLVREVTTLARLHHQHVVRYYHAWIDPAEEEDTNAFESTLDEIDSLVEMSEEDEEAEDFDDESNLNFSEPSKVAKTNIPDDDDDSNAEHDDDWLESASISRSKRVEDETSMIEPSKAIEATRTPQMNSSGKKEAKILYIQMEYCTTKTLRKIIDEGIKDEDEIWRFFRQIIEGLNHIHSQGIIHRDLKPGNIFIDSENNIKIGDFGLATSSVTRITSSISNSVSSDILDQSLTIGVGTPFYLAPEQDRIGAHYNQKVDIYSLGIIFFEMCYRFSTAMERALVLKNLREKIPKLPPDFVDKHPDKIELIKWLLEHDPDKRPTTIELLESEHLPPKLEEEILKEALRSIATPNTTIFSLLMEKLFSLTPDSHLDYTYDFNSPNATFEEKSQLELMTRKASVKQMKKIFKKHGAIQVDNSLLMPKHTLPQQKNVVHIMDDTGLLLQLPYDLTAPFARFVARQKIKNLRRYTIGKVYRKNVVGGQPRELTECDFDIVGPMQHKFVYCSEVLKVLCEVLADLSDLGPFMIRINNYKILDGVLQAFDIETKVQDQLRLLIGNVAKNTWVTTRKEILHKNLIPPKMVEFLGAVFSSTEPFNTVLDRIEQALGSRSRLVVEGIHEMRALFHFAVTFGVADKLKFDMSLVYNYQQFSDIVYQAYLTKHDIGVVAAGGCYDFLLSHFSTVPTAPNAKVGAGRFTNALQEGYRGMKQGLETTAVGVNFALDKIVAFIHRQKLDNQSSIEDMSNKTETDVFIYSINKNMLEDRIQLANQLWSMNIKAEYMYREDITLEELGTLCKNMGVFCIIVLRDTTYRNGIIKIKTTENLKGESTVKIRDLPELVAQSKQKAQKSKRPLHKQNSNQEIPTPEFSLNQARNQHIDVDILGNKVERGSKAKKKIENKAQNIISPVLKSLITYSNIYKVAAVDIPVKIIKEVVAQNRPHTEAINAVAEKYTNFKRSLLDLQEFLAKNRNLPFVFVYSIKDDGYVFIPCALDPLKEK